jgi:hypothetical protein
MDQHWPDSLPLKSRRAIKLRVRWLLQVIVTVLPVLVFSKPAVPLILLVGNKVARRSVVLNLFGSPRADLPTLAGVPDLSNLSLQMVRQDAMLLPVIFSSESEASNVEDTSVTMGRALSLEVKDLIGSALRMPPVPEAASWECRLPVGLNWQGVLQMAASSSFSRRGQNRPKLAVKAFSSFNYRGRFQSTKAENFHRIRVSVFAW